MPPESQMKSRPVYFFVKIVYSTSNRNSGKVMLSKTDVSRPTIFSPLITFSDLNTKNIIIPNEML